MLFPQKIEIFIDSLCHLIDKLFVHIIPYCKKCGLGNGPDLFFLAGIGAGGNNISESGIDRLACYLFELFVGELQDSDFCF